MIALIILSVGLFMCFLFMLHFVETSLSLRKELKYIKDMYDRTVVDRDTARLDLNELLSSGNAREHALRRGLEQLSGEEPGLILEVVYGTASED